MASAPLRHQKGTMEARETTPDEIAKKAFFGQGGMASVRRVGTHDEVMFTFSLDGILVTVPLELEVYFVPAKNLWCICPTPGAVRA